MAIWKKPGSGSGRKRNRKKTASAPPTRRADSNEPEASVSAPVESRPVAATNEVFRLGPTLVLKGELRGRIDVELEGRVEGKVSLDARDLVVCRSSRVDADVSARRVVVRGEVHGDVHATEKIVIESSGTVVGDICAPSISLADGSRFTGSINRESAPAKVCGALDAGRSEPPRRKPAGETTEASDVSVKADRRGSDRPWSEARSKHPEPRTPTPAL